MTDNEVRDFVVVNFSLYFKSTKEKSYSKLSEEQDLRKVAKSFYIFLTTLDEVQKHAKIIQLNPSDKYVHRYNIEVFSIFEPELQLINTKPMIRRTVNWVEKVQTIVVLAEHKEINDRKFFHSTTKLIASDSDIDKAFKSMRQSIMTKKYTTEDYIVLNVIIKHSIKIFECA